MSDLTQRQIPEGLINFDALRVFDGLDYETQIELVSDFYANRFAPYAYDFSLMSKHALSRIYERYISLVRPTNESQRLLFNTEEGAVETVKRDLGEVYTPQYIARFFARFLKDNTIPVQFRALAVIDPACGSGMFLRTLLEVQCDPFVERDINAVVDQAFSNVTGIDVEENACKATRLSLCLLHLALTGDFPQQPLKILSQNAIEYFMHSTELRSAFDAVIANPPYVRWEEIPSEWQHTVKRFLDDPPARPDLYVAFLKLGLDALRPGGFLLFVLPRTFLISESTRSLRRRLSLDYWIRHLVDLSDLAVFPDADSYPILLIAERKQDSRAPEAILTRCSGFAGHALEAVLTSP